MNIVNTESSTSALIVLATAWGSKHGGINSLSLDICVSVANLSHNSDVFCICPSVSDEDVKDAQANGVQLLGLAIDSDEVQEDWAQHIVPKIKTQITDKTVWWIGHDTITGPLAALYLALNMCKMWEQGDVYQRRRLQNLIFPKGLMYEHVNGGLDHVEIEKLLFAIKQITAS